MKAVFPTLMFLLLGCSSKPIEIAPPTDIIGPVGEFSLLDQHGKTITQADLAGKVWIASFVFTRCTDSCPQVTGAVARLQKELTGQADVRFVTFTVDPGRDNPDELAKYAEHYRADPSRWYFLTGSEANVKKVLEQFHVTPVHNPGAKNPSDEFDHSSKLVVVDRSGNIRGYFDGMRRSKSLDPEKDFDDAIAALKRSVSKALGE